MPEVTTLKELQILNERFTDQGDALMVATIDNFTINNREPSAMGHTFRCELEYFLVDYERLSLAVMGEIPLSFEQAQLYRSLKQSVLTLRDVLTRLTRSYFDRLLKSEDRRRRGCNLYTEEQILREEQKNWSVARSEILAECLITREVINRYLAFVESTENAKVKAKTAV